jgi:hypothetical protein
MPTGHQRRRYQALRPNRASSRAQTRRPGRCARVSPKRFFKSGLSGRVRLAVASAPGLELGLVAFEQLRGAVEASVIDPPGFAQVAAAFLTRAKRSGSGRSVPVVDPHDILGDGGQGTWLGEYVDTPAERHSQYELV